MNHTTTPLLDRASEAIILGANRRYFSDPASGKLRPMVEGAAITVSGLYITAWKKPFDGTDTIIDWVNDSIKQALYTNSLTPNYSTDTAYGSAPYTSNEISGTGYTAAGVALAGKTVTESPTGTLMFDCNDPAWSGATFSLVRGALVHDVTLSIVLCLVNYGADYGVTSGTFTDQVASTGRFTYDITP